MGAQVIAGNTVKGHHTSPFEVVYTFIYAYSLFAIGTDLIGRTMASPNEWLIVNALFGIFVCFQFLRMYAYLHSFDDVTALDKTHFLHCVDGGSKVADRVLRLVLASLLIFATKAPLDASMLRLRLSLLVSEVTQWFGIPSQATPALDAAIDTRFDLVTVYAFWLAFVFVTLMLWDLNVSRRLTALRKTRPDSFQHFRHTASAFFYVTGDGWDELTSHWLGYFQTPKFRERLYGLMFSLATLTYSAHTTPLVLMAAATFLFLFGIAYFTHLKGSDTTILLLLIVLWRYLELGSLFRSNPSGTAEERQ